MAGTNDDDDDDDVFHDRAGNYCTIHLLNERSVTTFAKCVCLCVRKRVVLLYLLVFFH